MILGKIDNLNMKIYLIGVGGVGGFYGGLLAESGADVTLVSRGESFVAIRKSGLVLNCSDGERRVFPVKVIEHVSEIIDPDLIILAVKSYNLEEVSRGLERVINDDTIVITIQNGLENDMVVSRHIHCQVLPGLVLVAASKTAPNKVNQRGSQRKLVFGARSGEITTKMREVESVLKSAGIDAHVSESITQELWKKFLFVLSFASATVVQMGPIGEALNNPQSLKVYKDVLRETITVGKGEGIEFEPDIFDVTLKGALDFDPLTKSSLLVDIQNHRQTEVEALHGVLVRLAERYNLPVPVTYSIYKRILKLRG
ncbi:MAG: 2-dehydropantoate 2-reductase [Candidatus Collierbacteria bacterium GW2011_GWA2_46_26]|uniref:2-dehydropantoate 2-reductase n=1 Tax=Candidatus Collierbacteria bacterium GW2011_GWA2_46_26 TaxID=1618381 RepID=A0A0G1PJY2_9BACT|nr:MAG: 2-dehydropantoate 2-reductase [Candidatus Collierbacteria bacterium GW2011_GWA2_46_26]